MCPLTVPVLQKTSAAHARLFRNEDDFSSRWKPAGTRVCLTTNESQTMKARILIVDDEPNVRLMFRSALESIGCKVFEADSGERALDQCLARDHDLALLDLRMPGGMDGLELLQEMVNRKIQTPVVIITAHGDMPNAVSAMKLGAIDFLKKPILPEELRNVVKDVLIRHEPEEVVDEDDDLDNCLRRAKRAINLRDFETAKRELINALEINPDSPQALNLVRVMLEMRNEYDQENCGQVTMAKAEKTSLLGPWKMQWIFKLFYSGSGKKPSDTETQ